MTTPLHDGIERPVKGVRRATGAVLEEIRWERYRQEQLWGEQNHPDGVGPEFDPDDHARALLVERWAKRRCDNAHKAGLGTYEQILTEEWAEVVASPDPLALRAELVQLAAVAAAWISKIDRDLAKTEGVTS